MANSRVLALDIGSVRIGAAVSDIGRRIAQGLGVWPAESWRDKFAACVEEYKIGLVVIGLPVRTDGTLGPEAIKIESLAEDLKQDYKNLEFDLYDERFTTRIALDALIGGGVSRAKRRGRVDKVAAVLILESWLERRRDL